jgi:hypothetical protein
MGEAEAVRGAAGGVRGLEADESLSVRQSEEPEGADEKAEGE